MAAPSATARQAPAGKRLRDGQNTKITFASDPDVELWEISVKPFGADNGDAISMTTMHNVKYHTAAPRTLTKITDGTFKFAYDAVMVSRVRAMVGKEDTITFTYADGSTDACYGYLKMVEFDEITEGNEPTGTGTIVCTNMDPSGAEYGPTFTNVAGT